MKAYSDNLISKSTGLTQQARSHGSGARHFDGDALSRTHQHLEESVRIRKELMDLGSGAAILQIADDSLALFGQNLTQMRDLTGEVLCGRDDSGILDAYNALARQNHEIAGTTSYQGTPLHRDGQTFEIYTSDQTAVVWQTHCLAAVDTDLLARPESVRQDIENALDHVLAYRNSILRLLTTLQENSVRCYLKLDSYMHSPTSVNTHSAAKMVAYRAATHILKAERKALAAHTYDLSAIARSCLA